MTLTIDAVYDGDVFRPQGHIDLRANMHYVIIVVDTQQAASPRPALAAQDAGGTLSVVEHDDRVRLIRKKVRGGLTDEEERELATLQARMDNQVDSQHPLPFEALRALEAALANNAPDGVVR